MIELKQFAKETDSLVIEGRALGWDREDLTDYFGHYTEDIDISKANFYPGGDNQFRVHLNGVEATDEFIETIKSQVPEDEQPRSSYQTHKYRGLSTVN